MLSARGRVVGFLEQLPDACPPDGAHDGGCGAAFRLTAGPNPTIGDFASNAALGEPLPPTVDPCRWASCSLFPRLDIIEKKRKAFKKLRKFKFVISLNIGAGCGKLIEDTTHIDFWIYDTFDLKTAVISVDSLPDA
jgi:hypothetical protein